MNAANKSPSTRTNAKKKTSTNAKKTKSVKTSKTTQTTKIKKAPVSSEIPVEATKGAVVATQVESPVEPKPELNAKQTRCVEAFLASFGNVAKACRAAKVDRSSFYRWKEESKAFRDAIETLQINDVIVDLAEEKLFEKLQAGSLPAIFFVLETRGASRGWSKTTNVAVSGPPTVVVQESDLAFFETSILENRIEKRD